VGVTNMFDLKNFRENSLKITQSEFAKLTGLRQDHVSRLEKTPKSISYEELIKIANTFGLTLDQLVNFKKPEPRTITVANEWKNNKEYKSTLVNYLDRKKFSNSVESLDVNFKIKDFKIKFYQIVRKPKIALVGRSDVGKSAMINFMLGKNVLPTAWTPTTSIAIYIKHKNDRPDFIEEDVWIMKDSRNDRFDIDMIDNQDYMNKWKLSVGNYELLKTYGTRENYIKSTNQSSAAVLFIDSDILNNCDLIDLPGYGTGDRVEDDYLTISIKKKADIIIYLSIANGFLRSEDIEYLKETITTLRPIENINNKLKPLNNLFVVASQAHTIDGGNINSLKKITDQGAERLYRTIPDKFFDEKIEKTGLKYDLKSIKDRFYHFSIDTDALSNNLVLDLVELTTKISRIIEKESKVFVKDYVKNSSSSFKKLIDSYDKLIDDKKAYINLIEDIKKTEPVRIKETNTKKEFIINSINETKSLIVDNFRDKYESIINEEYIVSTIKKLNMKNNKEDIKSLLSYLNTELQTEVSEMLGKESKSISKEINKFILGFDSSNLTEVNTKLQIPPFDQTEIFTSGLAGLATFGALAFWASTMGNLGGYALVAHGVGILSSLGVSFTGAGAAGVMSGVFAIGGPVTLAIGLSLLTAFSAFMLVTNINWEKNLAKKIVKEFNNKFVLNEYYNVVINYWDSTKIAFNTAASNLEKEWKKYQESIESMVDNYDTKDIEKKINYLKEIKSFFENTPL
jgi:transcriptional regulator with XRE-family HTH domain